MIIKVAKEDWNIEIDQQLLIKSNDKDLVLKTIDLIKEEISKNIDIVEFKKTSNLSAELIEREKLILLILEDILAMTLINFIHLINLIEEKSNIIILTTSNNRSYFNLESIFRVIEL